ncbi:MAG: hypothetical protein ACJ71S_08610 [Acidobacteriaceae bacterium]
MLTAMKLPAVCLALLLGFSTLPAFARNHNPPAQSIFDFHSGFWVNLHHFLYLEALTERPEEARRPASLSTEDLTALRALTPQEHVLWDEAVAYYAHSMIQRDLLFDRDLIATQIALEDAEASSDLGGTELAPELKSVLQKAAPIYRNHWWPMHYRKNRAWIQQLEPLIGRYGDSLKNSLAKICETPWQTEPVRVDMVMYANWAGAYTTVGPTRVTISASEPANPEAGALETVFHESSHALVDKMRAAIDEAAAVENAHRTGPPFQSGNIWHAVLFYTAGALVAQQIPGYVPFADRGGLWKRAWPDPDRALTAADWQPHIDGRTGLQPSLAKLVSDLASQHAP